MKILRLIIIISFVIFGILFLTLELTIKLNGRQIAVERLSAAFNRKVSIKKVKYAFPSGIFIKELDIPSALSTQGAKFTIDFPASLGQRQIVFNEITLIEPAFYIEKRPGSRYIWGVYSSSKFQGGGGAGNNFGQSAVFKGIECLRVSDEKSQDKAKGGEPPQEKDDGFIDLIEPFGKMSAFGVTVNYLKVVKGYVHFMDYSTRKTEPDKIDFKNIYVKISDLAVPSKSIKTAVDCAGVISAEDHFFDQSWFEFNGWVNLDAKDMDVQLKVIDPNGVINLFSRLDSKNNDMLVRGRFSIKGRLSQKRMEDFQASSFGDFMMVAVQKSKMDVDLKYSFNTKMDDFKIEKVNISGDLGINGGDSQ